MLKIITNNNNLEECDINSYVIRVKALIINSKGEILIAKSHGDYQFPGGKIEENENLIDALNREVEEETGIKLNIKNLNYIATSIGYWKDHPRENINRKTIVYYFAIKTNKKPNINNTKYTQSEIDGNFKLNYYKIDDMLDLLNNSIKEKGDKFSITLEMIKVLKYYMKGE